MVVLFVRGGEGFPSSCSVLCPPVCRKMSDVPYGCADMHCCRDVDREKKRESSTPHIKTIIFQHVDSWQIKMKKKGAPTKKNPVRTRKKSSASSIRSSNSHIRRHKIYRCKERQRVFLSRRHHYIGSTHSILRH